MNLIWLAAALVLFACTADAQVCVREGSKCWQNDATSRNNWCRSNNLNQELHQYTSGTSTCYCCYTCCRTISVVSAIPDYLPEISVKHSSSSAFQTVNSGSSLQLTNFDFYATSVTLRWGSATATHNFANGVSPATLMVTESNPAWSGTKPPMPSGIKTIISAIPTHFTTSSFVCTLNGTNALTKNNVANGQSGSYSMNYVSYGSCNLSWGAARLTFPIAGSDLDSRFEISEAGVIHTSKVPQSGQIWPWTGTKPEIQHVTKTIVSHIPNYFPSFTAKCVINGTITILDTTMLSGRSSTVMKVDVLSTGQCVLTWGAASLTVPLQQNTLTHINAFETHVFLSTCPTCSGTRYNWPGTRPALPVGRKSIVSHIPSYLPSFTAVCKNNATDLPLKEITSGLTHAYDLDYLSSGNCALKWGTATISFPVSGKDLTATYVVDEAKVTYTRSASGTSGASWRWSGTTPRPPIGAKSILSRIPSYLPSFSVECYNNATALPIKIVTSGLTHTYNLEYLHSGHCLLAWDTATVTFLVSGRDLNARYEVDEVKVKYVESANGTAGKEWSWSGTTPKEPVGTKSILSRIPSYFPTFSAKCTQNTTNVLDQILSSGQTQTYSMTYLSSGNCELRWGSATVAFPVSGKDLTARYDVDEQKVTYASSSNGTEGATWSWQGNTPLLPKGLKYITSDIPYYMPAFTMTCKVNSTTLYPVTISPGETSTIELDILTNANCTLLWGEAQVSFPVYGADLNSRYHVNDLHVIYGASNNGEIGHSWDWIGEKPPLPIGSKKLYSHIPNFYPAVQVRCVSDSTLLLDGFLPRGPPLSFDLDYISTATCKLTWGDAWVSFTASGKDMHAEYDIDEFEVIYTESSSGNIADIWDWEGTVPKMPEGEKSIVSHIPDYLPPFMVQCNVDGNWLPNVNVSSGETNTHLVEYIRASGCTLTWGTARVTFALIGSDLDCRYEVDERKVTFAYSSNGTAGATWNWSGVVPTPPVGIKSLVSHIPHYLPSVTVNCDRNSTALPGKALASGETWTFELDYLSTGICRLTWGTASVTFPVSGKDMVSRFDIDEIKVKFGVNVNGPRNEVWEWTGVRPSVPVGTKSITSHIPYYLPSVIVQCNKNSTALAEKTLASGQTHTYELNYLTNGECNLKWDSATVNFPVLGRDLNSRFIFDEVHVIYTQSNGTAGAKWAWQGTIPKPPVGIKSIVSHIPYYLPSVNIQCKRNSTTLPNQTLTTGATQSYSMDYLSSGDCTLTWGSATVTFPVSGKDLTSRFDVDEEKVTFGYSSNRTVGSTWAWQGAVPTPPVGTKSIVSHIPDYLPNIIINCERNSTKLPEMILYSGETHSFQLDYLSTANCQLTWGLASVKFPLSGKDLTSRFDVDELRVQHSTNINGTTNEAWQWTGVTPGPPVGVKSIVSHIPYYFPPVSVQCNKNSTSLMEKILSSGETHRYHLDYLTSGDCTLKWGSATIVFPVSGKDMNSEFIFDEMQATYIQSDNGSTGDSWTWQGTKPKLPVGVKSIVSHQWRKSRLGSLGRN